MKTSHVRRLQLAAVGLAAVFILGTYPGGSVANDCIVSASRDSCSTRTNPQPLCTIDIVESGPCSFTYSPIAGTAGFKSANATTVACRYFRMVKSGTACVRDTASGQITYMDACSQATGDACTKTGTIDCETPACE